MRERERERVVSMTYMELCSLRTTHIAFFYFEYSEMIEMINQNGYYSSMLVSKCTCMWQTIVLMFMEKKIQWTIKMKGSLQFNGHL